MSTIRIAIDGPSGAGKSTLARSIAEKLGYLYVDTGAIYRTLGYHIYAKGLNPKDGTAVSAELPGLRVEMSHGRDGLQRMLLNGQDVTERIRLPEVSMYASLCRPIPSVPDLSPGDAAGAGPWTHNVIMDGRDIGTVVLPDAEVKVFLTASPETRAHRRMLELEDRGTPEPYEKVLADIQKRDWDDSHRAVAPLPQAEDAVVLDTTALNFRESEEALLRIIRERTAKS